MDEIRPTTSNQDHIVGEGGSIVIDVNEQSRAQIILTPDGDELVPLVGAPITLPAVLQLESSGPAGRADPEFDAYLAVVKLLIGGTIEGAAELIKRLEKWEVELGAADNAPDIGEIRGNGDAARYLLVGLALSTSDGLRRRAIKVTQASDLFWKFTGNAAQPLVNNRLTGIVARPLDRAFDRLVARGQTRINDWVELGRTHEPGARRIARKTYEEVVDEFIGQLADNQELADLVQKKSVGLATEAVDEFRSRTVSADAMAENIVRRILRRPPRGDLAEPTEDIRLAAGVKKPDEA